MVNQVLTGSKNRPQNIKKNDFIGRFEIDTDNLSTATNSSKIVISGYASNYDLLEFYINKIEVKEINLISENFSQEIGDLEKGENEVFLIAKSTKANQSKKSEKFTVIYKNDKPKLEIIEPKDQSKTNSAELKIVGNTDKETFIKINSLPIVVDAQGKFQTLLKLNQGENKIEVVAQDIVGNTETKTVTVNYQKEE